MKSILSNFERFVVHAFNFHGRATMFDYWLVMPFIWLLIVAFFIADLGEVYAMLLARQIPPLNPLFYASVLIFLLTLIPRTSVTIRRFHDSNRSGFWILLPMISFVSLMVMFALLTGSMMNSALTGIADDPDNVFKSFDTLVESIITGTFWNEMFGIAQAFEKAGADTVWGLLNEIYNYNGQVDIRRSSSNVDVGLEGDTGHTMALFMISSSLVLTPIVTGVATAILTLLPTSPFDNIYGAAHMTEFKYAKADPNERNVMSGYAHLFEKTDEEKAELRELQKAQLKELYRSRVLKQQEEPPRG